MKTETFEKLSKIPGMSFLMDKLNIHDDEMKELMATGEEELPPPGPSDGSEKYSATNILERGKARFMGLIERWNNKLQQSGEDGDGVLLDENGLPIEGGAARKKRKNPLAALISLFARKGKQEKKAGGVSPQLKKRASMAVVAFAACLLAVFGFMKRDSFALGSVERSLTKAEIAPLLDPPDRKRFDQYRVSGTSAISQECASRFTEEGSVPQWLMQVGLDNIAKQDWDGAVRVLTGGFEEAKKTGNREQQGCFQSFLGAVYERMGDRKKAIEAYMEAHRAAAVPWPTDVVLDLELRLERMKAQKEVQKGLRQSLDYQIPADYVNLARESMKKDLDMAEAYYRFAQDYIDANGEARPAEYAVVLMGLASLYEKRGKLQEAELLYWEALHQAQSHNELLRMGQAADGLAWVITEQGRKIEGRKMAKQALRYYKEGDLSDTPEYKQAEEWIYSSGFWPSWVPMQERLPG